MLYLICCESIKYNT